MNSKSSLATFIELPLITDDCQLVIAQQPAIPFEIKRIYYITQANPKLSRGFHAHKKTKQILFCIHGSIDITLDTGYQRETVSLNKPNQGIWLPPMLWHEMHTFTAETILLVMASHQYDAEDYIRDYTVFRKLATRKS